MYRGRVCGRREFFCTGFSGAEHTAAPLPLADIAGCKRTVLPQRSFGCVRPGPALYTGTGEEVTLPQALTDGPKTLVGLGAKVLIFPDKAAFDTATGQLTPLGALWQSENAQSIEFAPCDGAGRVYAVHSYGETEPENPSDGQVFLKTRNTETPGGRTAGWRSTVRPPATGRR